MYGYIYITINLINNKQYIGQHKSNIFTEDYKGSGKLLKQSILKYGIENFKTELIDIADSKEELNNNKEKYWIKYYNATNNRMFYNIAEGGDGGHTIAGYSEEELNKFKKKMSKITSGNNNPMYGKRGKDSPLFGRTYSEEFRIKISESNKNREISEATRRKMSNSRLGKDPWNKGKHMSEEFKEKLSEVRSVASTGRKWINNGITNKFVNNEELQYYLDNGWIIGRTYHKRRDLNKI